MVNLEVPKPWPWLLDRGLQALTLHQELSLLGVAVQELLGVGDVQSGSDSPAEAPHLSLEVR